MRGGVSLVQQVFPPRAEGFPPPREGFLPHALSALDVWVRLGRRAGAHNKMGDLVGGCQSGEGLPFPGCLGAVGMYPSLPCYVLPPGACVRARRAPRALWRFYDFFPLRLAAEATPGRRFGEQQPAGVACSGPSDYVLQGTGFDPARAA
jgi:hypothetical protein